MSGMRIRVRAPERQASTDAGSKPSVRPPERETGPSLEDLPRRAPSGFNALQAPVHPAGVTVAPPVPPRFRLGNPADRFEREAEGVARRVGPALAGAGSRTTEPREAETSGGQGTPLPGALQAPLEEALGAELGSVRLHTGSTADTVARGFRARAVTVDRDVLFRQGEYRPETSGGRELLAHELTHVVQQNPELAVRGLAPVVRQTLGRVVPQLMLALPENLGELRPGYAVFGPFGKIYRVTAIDLQAGQLMVVEEDTNDTFSYSIETEILTRVDADASGGRNKRGRSDSPPQSPGPKRPMGDIRSFLVPRPPTQAPPSPSRFPGSAFNFPSMAPPTPSPGSFPSRGQGPAVSAAPRPPGVVVTRAGVAKMINDSWGNRKLLLPIRKAALDAVSTIPPEQMPEALEKAQALAAQAIQYFEMYDTKGLANKVVLLPQQEAVANNTLGKLQALTGIQPVAPPVLPAGIEKTPSPTTKIKGFAMGTAYAVKTGPEGAKQGKAAFGWDHSDYLNQQYKEEPGVTFVAGHLVGVKIGGPFIAKNLSPFTNEFNTSGSREDPKAGIRAPEAEAERRLGAGKVVSYEAKVTYGRDPFNRGDYDFAYDWMAFEDLPLVPKKVDVTVATLKPPENADRTDIGNWTEETDVKPFAPELILPRGKEENSQEE